jgi:hypothetical protein
MGIQELQDEIKVLSKMKGMESSVAAKKAELAALQKGGASADLFVVNGLDEDDLKSGSKFAAAGLHLSEFGMPVWQTVNVSIAFPFTIIDGPDTGKENKIVAGVGPKAAWKLGETLTALDVAHSFKAGKLTFNPLDVVGKQAMTLWVEKISEKEESKGNIYTQPTKVVKPGTEAPADMGQG